MNRALVTRRSTAVLPPLVLALACGVSAPGDRAALAQEAQDIYVKKSVYRGSDYGFDVRPQIWRDLLSQRPTIERGEPVFLDVWLSFSGPPLTEVGLDGPTLADSSLDVLLGPNEPQGGEGWKPALDLPTEPGAFFKPVGMLRRPPDHRLRHVILAVWFQPDEGGEGGGGGAGPRRLVFDRPGNEPLWVRFPRVLIPGGTVANTSWLWAAGTSKHNGALTVQEATPPVARFAADVAAVISADLIVPPEHRPMLEKHAAADPKHRVARWAEWLLLRSHVADPAWRAALAKRDPDALAAFKKHEPAARRFLTEHGQMWMRTPPWYEARLFLAAEFASRSPEEAELAEAGVQEVLGEYVGARAAWDAGKAAADAKPAAGGPGGDHRAGPKPRVRVLRADAEAEGHVKPRTAEPAGR